MEKLLYFFPGFDGFTLCGVTKKFPSVCGVGMFSIIAEAGKWRVCFTKWNSFITFADFELPKNVESNCLVHDTQSSHLISGILHERKL